MTGTEPTNSRRAEWAKAALALFTAETFGGDHPDAMPLSDLEDAITDLICDLLHLVEILPPLDASAIHARALAHFEDEIKQEQPPDRTELVEALRLCEDALSSLARLDDGTPSVSALNAARALIARAEQTPQCGGRHD
jgi:hypothetical protein